MGYKFKDRRPYSIRGRGINNTGKIGIIRLDLQIIFPVPEDDDSDENTFGILIHGDSMDPEIREGDIAIVVPSAPLVSGKLCFASLHNDPKLVKRYRTVGGAIYLESNNSKYEPIVIDDENYENTHIYYAIGIFRSS